MKKTVLIVDDEPDLREVLRGEFESEGYLVDEAESGNKAYDMLQQKKFDMVVSDLRMPDGSGIDLIRKIKKDGQESPVVIFISGYSEMKPEEIYNLGAEGILPKPWKPEKLFDMVSTLLSSKEKRWSRKSDRFEYDSTVELHCQSFKDGLETKILNIGRGGMFVAMQDDFPCVGEKIAFSFRNPQNAAVIEGVATVRWIRAEASIPSMCGVGLEFVELSDSQRLPLLALLLQITPKSFIPQRI